MFTTPGFLGTNAPIMVDITLLAEIVFFILLTIGVVAQRRGNYHLHDYIQTPVVILNTILVMWIMVFEFFGRDIAQTAIERPQDPYFVVATIHGIFGSAAAILSIYCLLAGWKILPRNIGRLKYVMWVTYIIWTCAVLLGVATYYIWYVRVPPVVEAEPVAPVSEVAADATGSDDGAVDSAAVADAPPANVPPPPQRVLMQNFEYVERDLSVPAGTSVTWLNQDGAPHNVTFVDGSFETDNFFAGESAEFTFSEPGSFVIYCTLHGGSDGSGMASTITVLEAEDSDVAGESEAVAAAPATLPPPPPPPEPTPAPELPPPPIEPLQAVEPESAPVVGLLSFYDALTPNDSVTLLLTAIEPAAAGFELQAWLTSQADGVPPLNFGRITPDASGRALLSYSDPNGESLVARYDGVTISSEPEFDDDPTIGDIVYAGNAPSNATGDIRNLLVRVEPSGGIGYGIGARHQTEELLRHVEFIVTANELLSIADAQRHSEHVVNLLEGESGEYYGDLDGAHGIQNPGDGVGILTYIDGMRSAAERAATAEDSTTAIQLHSTHVVIATGNASTWATAIRDAALAITQADRVEDIGEYVATIETLSPLLLSGSDDNGDGVTSPNEGGVFQAYQHAQYMAAIAVSTK